MNEARHRDLTNIIARARTIEALDAIRKATLAELTLDLHALIAQRVTHLKEIDNAIHGHERGLQGKPDRNQ